MSDQLPVERDQNIPLHDIEAPESLEVVDGRCVLGPVDDIPTGARRIYSVGGRQGIGVFNLGDSLVAIRNVCPHRGGPLCYGRLRPHVVAEGVGQIAFEREGEILKCPWHQWEFDLRTGFSLYPPRLRVQTYAVSVENGLLILHVDE